MKNLFVKTSLPCNESFETTNLQLHYKYPMEIRGIKNRNAILEIHRVLL